MSNHDPTPKAGDSMSKSDWELFNCSEEWESGYVREQYTDPQGVKDYLKKKCDSNEIDNSTHEQVYELLEEAGFEKK